MNRVALVTVFLFASAFAGTIDTRRETTCQTHRRNTNGGLMQWNITCDAEGKYSPAKQCTVQTPKWCRCYHDDGEASQPSRSIQMCECFLAKYRAEEEQRKGRNPTGPIPKCERSGKFEKKQCDVVRQQCQCVDPMTGQPKTQLSSNRNLQCL